MQNCPMCGSTKTEPADYADEISWKERNTTGLCQECQDKIFVPHSEDMDLPDNCMRCGEEFLTRDLVRGQVCLLCQVAREREWQEKLIDF